MEIVIIIFILLALGCYFCPGVFVLFMPNIKGFGCLSSVLIGMLLVCLFGWWGLLAYLLICLIKND